MLIMIVFVCLFLLTLHIYRPFFWAVWIVSEASASPFHRFGRFLLKLVGVYVGYAEWTNSVGHAKCPKCGEEQRGFPKGNLNGFSWHYLHCQGIKCYTCGARAIYRFCIGQLSIRPYIADNIRDTCPKCRKQACQVDWRGFFKRESCEVCGYHTEYVWQGFPKV